MAETQVRDAEIVPQIPMESLQKANAELSALQVRLAGYEAEAKAIVVDSPEKFLEAGNIKVKVKDERKRWEWTVKPIESIASTITNTIRTMKQAGTNKCEQIEGILQAKMLDQKRLEAQAAAAEERRDNEERTRRAAEAAEEQRKIREKQIEADRKAGEIGKREAERLRKEALEQEKIEAANVQTVKVIPNTPKIAGLRNESTGTPRE